METESIVLISGGMADRKWDNKVTEQQHTFDLDDSREILAHFLNKDGDQLTINLISKIKVFDRQRTSKAVVQ